MRVITIGRSSENDISINDPNVSRHHCQIIQHDDGHFTIADLGSANGTFVNGKRIYGNATLFPNDMLLIGNTTLPWQSYFMEGVPQQPVQPQPPKRKSHALPIVLGVVGGLALVAIIVVVALLVFNRPKHQYNIDGVSFDFGMTLDELRSGNTSASVRKYSVPAEDNIEVYIPAFDYYIINNMLAIAFNNKTKQIQYFSTYDPDFSTPEGIHPGSTWGEMEDAYPNLEYQIWYFNYDHFTHKYHSVIFAQDSTTSTSFVFDYNLFSDKQIEEISRITNPSCFDAYFTPSELPDKVHQTIRTSITVSHITITDKNQPDDTDYEDIEGRIADMCEILDSVSN